MGCKALSDLRMGTVTANMVEKRNFSTEVLAYVASPNFRDDMEARARGIRVKTVMVR